MIVLALDTATREASVALTSSNRRILAQASATVTTHSERLLGLIDRVMRAGAVRLADVTAVVCGCGPGSFTGLRIGLATAKGLCFAAGRPLCCVSSLDALGQVRAAGLVTDDPESIYALLDARRGQLYWRRYDGLGRSRGELTIGAPAALADEVAGGRPLLVGEGALVYREALAELIPAARFAPEGAHAIRAAELAFSAEPAVLEGRFSSVATAVPHYLREPDIRPARSARAGDTG